jgi:hypothetical protein
VLFGLGLRFATEVRAQPAQPKPAAPATPAAADAGAPVAPPGADAGVAEPPAAADAAAPETTTAAPDAPEAAATPEASAPASGSGLFEQSQGADTSAAAGSEGSAAPSYNLGGYVRGDAFVGKVPGFRQPETKAMYGELSMKLTVKKEEYGDAYAEARVRYGLQGQEQRVFLDLREAYVNAYLGPLDLRLGQQIVVWGRADAFNPTNNVTPVDLRIRSPVEDDRRVGNVGVRTFLNFQPMRLEGVWMPIYVPSELPTGIITNDLVAFDTARFPPPELSKGLEAARLHLELPAFETSVSYLYGYAPLPGLSLSTFETGVDPEVRISRTAYNHHVVGFDFSTALGDVLALRGEAAYRSPVNWRDKLYAPHPDVAYVFGADKTFGSVNIIAQYMGRYVFDWELQNGSPRPLNEEALTSVGPTDMLNPVVRQEITESINLELAKRNQILFSQRAQVQHLATARIEWLTAHDSLSLSAFGMVNFTTQEWLVFPKLLYKMSDSLSTSIGAEIYAGPEDTLFGYIDELLSAGYAELRASF